MQNCWFQACAGLLDAMILSYCAYGMFGIWEAAVLFRSAPTPNQARLGNVG